MRSGVGAVLLRAEFAMLVFRRTVTLAVSASVLAITAIGCSHVATSEERLDAELKRSGMQRGELYPFAGQVSVDGQPLAAKSSHHALIVIAYDSSKPELSAKARPFVTVKPDGTFEFPDGGLPPGSYVLTFAALQHNKKKGWHGPDQLKNLYNDPDVNAKKTEFKIEHHSPGRTDYLFDLPLAGQEAVAAPGPKAITQIGS
jgi:hypothetical protein